MTDVFRWKVYPSTMTTTGYFFTNDIFELSVFNDMFSLIN